MNAIYPWIIANPEAAGALLMTILSAASGIAEMCGWTGVSKIIGVITFDAGRILRYAKKFDAGR